MFAVFLIFAFLYLSTKKTAGLKRFDLTLAFGVKLGLALMFMYIYSRVYGVGAETVDWEEYIHDSVVLRNVAFLDFSAYLRFLFGISTDHDIQQFLMNTNHWSAGDLALMNDSRNVLRVNSLIAFVFDGNLYYHIVFISFFVVLAFRELYLGLADQVWINKRLFWVLLTLFPSVAFWTSSMLKEPFMMIGLCLLISVVFRRLTAWGKCWRATLGFLLMLAFKPYVLLCLLLPILLFLVWKILRVRILVSFIVVMVVFAATMVFAPSVRHKGVHQVTRMQYDFINVGRGGVHVLVNSSFYYFAWEQGDSYKLENDSLYVIHPLVAKHVQPGMRLPFDDIRLTPDDGPWPIFFKGDRCGSYFPVTPINDSFSQLMLNIPEALFNASFRPTPLDKGGNLKWFNFLETIALFGFILFVLIRVKLSRTSEQKVVIYCLLIFAVTLLMLIGWTTPVMGALVRYRVPAYLVLFLVAVLGRKKISLK